jgi:hypothetical protein
MSAHGFLFIQFSSMMLDQVCEIVAPLVMVEFGRAGTRPSSNKNTEKTENTLRRCQDEETASKN